MSFLHTSLFGGNHGHNSEEAKTLKSEDLNDYVKLSVSDQLSEFNHESKIKKEEYVIFKNDLSRRVAKWKGMEDFAVGYVIRVSLKRLESDPIPLPGAPEEIVDLGDRHDLVMAVAVKHKDGIQMYVSIVRADSRLFQLMPSDESYLKSVPWCLRDFATDPPLTRDDVVYAYTHVRPRGNFPMMVRDNFSKSRDIFSGTPPPTLKSPMRLLGTISGGEYCRLCAIADVKVIERNTLWCMLTKE